MRIGILGGVFDPIHNGHLLLAEAVFKGLLLKRLYFVPSHVSPVTKKEQTPSDLRFTMTEAAVRGRKGFYVSDVELKRGGVSYTIDTVREFRKEFPKPHELFLIVGADWAGRLDQWKDIKSILSLCQCVIASRPGFELKDLPKGVQTLLFSPFDVSSTQIREMIRAGEDVSRLVPPEVCRMIQKNRLYVQPNENIKKK